MCFTFVPSALHTQASLVLSLGWFTSSCGEHALYSKFIAVYCPALPSVYWHIARGRTTRELITSLCWLPLRTLSSSLKLQLVAALCAARHADTHLILDACRMPWVC
jgi:hypothetical protein